MGKIQAVIFDLDGTLIDSEGNYLKADQRLFADYGFMGYDWKLHSQYIGFGSREMLEEMKEKHHIEEPIETLLRKKNQYYIEIAQKNTIVFPEMLKFLKQLKEQGYALALASGSSPAVIRAILEITGMGKYFSVVLSAEDVRKGKPEPDIFLEAAKRLDVAPESCLVMEDSHFGVDAAKRAGMYCVAIPAPIPGPSVPIFKQADLCLDDGIDAFLADEVYDWLQKVQ